MEYMASKLTYFRAFLCWLSAHNLCWVKSFCSRVYASLGYSSKIDSLLCANRKIICFTFSNLTQLYMSFTFFLVKFYFWLISITLITVHFCVIRFLFFYRNVRYRKIWPPNRGVTKDLDSRRGLDAPLPNCIVALFCFNTKPLFGCFWAALRFQFSVLNLKSVAYRWT